MIRHCAADSAGPEDPEGAAGSGYVRRGAQQASGADKHTSAHVDRAVAALLVHTGFDAVSNRWQDLLLHGVSAALARNDDGGASDMSAQQGAGRGDRGNQGDCGSLSPAQTASTAAGPAAPTPSAAHAVEGEEPPHKRRAVVCGNEPDASATSKKGAEDKEEAEAGHEGETEETEEGGGKPPAAQDSLCALRTVVLNRIAGWACRAKRYTEMCGRRKTNLIDMAQALRDQGMSMKALAASANEFSGDKVSLYSAALRSPSLSSQEAAGPGSSMPVPQEIPCVLNDPSLGVQRPAHMPEHLPAFPDPHTFVRTPVFEPVHASYVQWRRDRSRLAHEAEIAAVRLHRRLGRLDAASITFTSKLHPRGGDSRHSKLHAYVSQGRVLDYAPYVVNHDLNPEAHKEGQAEEEGGGGRGGVEDLHLENDAQIAASNEARVRFRIELPE